MSAVTTNESVHFEEYLMMTRQKTWGHQEEKMIEFYRKTIGWYLLKLNTPNLLAKLNPGPKQDLPKRTLNFNSYHGNKNCLL